MTKPALPLVLQILAVVNQAELSVERMTFENFEHSNMDNYTKNELLHAAYWLESHGYILRQKDQNKPGVLYKISPQGQVLTADILNDTIRSPEDIPD